MARILAEQTGPDGDNGDTRSLRDITITGAAGEKLSFDAYIDDDGGCIDLMGPYDKRDEIFTADKDVQLRNSKFAHRDTNSDARIRFSCAPLCEVMNFVRPLLLP
jgi:hypothetical protein